MAVPRLGFMEDLVTAVIAEVFLKLILCLKRFVKRQTPAHSPFHCDSSIVGACAVKSEFSIFP